MEEKVEERKKGRNNLKIAKYKIICMMCNHEFLAYVPFAKYCSKKCKRKATYLFGNEYIPHPRKLTYINCYYCGKKVKKEPGDLRHSKSGKLYCNKSCKMKAEVKRKSIIRYCYICGRKIIRTPSNNKQNVFCSRKCCNLWKRQFTGNKTPNWKGGYNKDERTLIRSRKFWKELRQEILNFFNGKCAKCGKNEYHLHIHHIRPVRLGGLDVKDNLIPLCPTCHSRQTVSDWEKENEMSWRLNGAHTLKGGGKNGGL